MISLKFDWPNLVPINKAATSSPVSLQLASIVVVETESGGSVDSINGKTGDVVLTANDVGADIAGSALAVSDALQPQITINTDAVAMLVALLSALQASKADLTYVNDQIANLVGTDTQTLATIQAITDALAENEGLLEALDQTVANRVRFDVATQGLTALQKYNARTNIGAEEIGTAALLINQITAASIGAVTAAQLATVATTGSYNDLTNKPNITGTLLTGLTTVVASAITATDSVIGALAKLQASIETKADAANTLLALGLKQDKLPTGTAGQFLAHDLTFKTPASGGSGDGITWVDLVLFGSEFRNTAYDPLMIGKSILGDVYIKGTLIKNTPTTLSSAIIAFLPTEYKTLQFVQAVKANGQIHIIASVCIMSQQNTAPWQLQLRRFDPSTNVIQIAGAAWAEVNGSLVCIPPTFMGRGV